MLLILLNKKMDPGAVAGMIGAWGAMEAIKVIAGLGEPLAGRLLMFDLARATCRLGQR